MYNSEVLSVWIKRRRYAYGLDYYKKNSRCIAKSIPEFNSLHSAIKIDKLFSLLFSLFIKQLLINLKQRINNKY